MTHYEHMKHFLCYMQEDKSLLLPQTPKAKITWKCVVQLCSNNTGWMCGNLRNIMNNNTILWTEERLCIKNPLVFLFIILMWHTPTLHCLCNIYIFFKWPNSVLFFLSHRPDSPWWKCHMQAKTQHFLPLALLLFFFISIWMHLSSKLKVQVLSWNKCNSCIVTSKCLDMTVLGVYYFVSV